MGMLARTVALLIGELEREPGLIVGISGDGVRGGVVARRGVCVIKGEDV